MNKTQSLEFLNICLSLARTSREISTSDKVLESSGELARFERAC